jgi:hypothetical protein
MNYPTQARLIELIKQQMPKNQSLTQELCFLLGLSGDAIYRRIRCQTAFTLDEATLICKHFDIPLEALNELIGNKVSFSYHPSGPDGESFRGYLEHFLKQIKGISSFQKRHIYYAAEDIPVFHHFAFPKLTDFKFFYWRKTILNHADLQKQKFEAGSHDHSFLDLSTKASLAYSEVETTEVWTDETIGSTIKQIRFYHDAGLFATRQDALDVVEDLMQLILNVQRQCELGYKIRHDGVETSTPYTFFMSDLMIGNNCVLVKTNDIRSTFIGFNTFNSMSTRNLMFNDQNERWMKNLISKSTQISQTAEKIRNQFFQAMTDRVEALRKQVSG